MHKKNRLKMNYNNSKLGDELHLLCDRLFPINRSLTGKGVRKTLSILKEYLPEMVVCEVPSGTKCFDWTIPDEWNINSAYIISPEGCLLYTSPSPRDRTRSRMPSSA